MRFTRATECTTEILVDLARWHSEGVTLEGMRLALLTGRAISVSQNTVGNWLRGRVPKGVAVPPVTPGRLRNDVPRGTGANRPLRFSKHTGSHYLRAPFRGGTYTIGYHRGRNGVRYLCWWFPEGVHQFDRDGLCIAGGPPVGLFSMRRRLRQARADAVHHARTGELRP